MLEAEMKAMINPPLRGRGLRFIVAMLLFDAVVLWLLFSWQYLDVLFSGEEQPLAPLTNAVMVVAVVLLALGMTLRVPPAWKDAIVLWRMRDAFCARRAFSELAQNDYRYRVEILQQKLGLFPREPASQLALWEQLYRKHAGMPMIRQMHWQYLLCYEIAAVSLLLIPPMLVPVAIRWSTQQMLLAGPLYLLGQYAMFVVATRFMGDNLVQAVLAVEATQA